MANAKEYSVWLTHGNNKPRDEASFSYIQDRNVFWNEDSKCPHCKEAGRTVDHLATRCDRMLYHDYTRRHNEVVKCLHMLMSNKYEIAPKPRKRIRGYSVQDIMSNDRVEIRVDTRIKTTGKISHDRPDIMVLDKVKREITLIEVGITNQDSLITVETEKMRKYDF